MVVVEKGTIVTQRSHSVLLSYFVLLFQYSSYLSYCPTQDTSNEWRWENCIL